MNLPNKLTWLRIGLTIIILILLLFPFYQTGISFPKYLIGGVYVQSQYLVAGFLFILASITDLIDGMIARKYHLVTDMGKMLDAIADKLLVDTVLVVLAAQGFIAIWIPVIIIMRDFIVDAIKMQGSLKGKVVGAILPGKIKTACLMVGISLVLFYNLPFELWNIQVADFLLYFATIMAVLSGWEYYQLNRKAVIKEQQN